MRARIEPGTRQDAGRLNMALAKGAALGTRLRYGTRPERVFTTLAKHRRLFRRWLPFSGLLLLRGRLPSADTELLVLRTAHLCGAEYEWRHHTRIAPRRGLTAADVERVPLGPDAPGWTPRQVALLRAADELHADRTLSDAAWAELRRHLTEEAAVIELCMLVGQYEMLAMTLNALRVQPE